MSTYTLTIYACSKDTQQFRKNSMCMKAYIATSHIVAPKTNKQLKKYT